MIKEILKILPISLMLVLLFTACEKDNKNSNDSISGHTRACCCFCRGIVVFTEGKKANEIDALQVQPDNLGTLSGDGYKRVGTSIITTLQEMYPKKPMKVTSSHDAIGFYEKCGFKSTGVNLKYVWNA